MPSQHSAALARLFLSKAETSGDALDLLWRLSTDHSHAKTAPSSALAKRLAKGSAETAAQIAALTKDPEVLALLARDKRKTVLLAVAKNPATSRDTLHSILTRAVLDASDMGEKTVSAAMSHLATSWEEFLPLARLLPARAARNEEYRAMNLLRTASKEAWKEALTLGWHSFSTRVVTQVASGLVPDLTLEELFASFSREQAARTLSSSVSYLTALPLETAREMLRLMPVWGNFAHYRDQLARSLRTPLSEEVLALLESSEEEEIRLLLAALPGVPTETRLRLVQDQKAATRLVSLADVEDEVLLAALAAHPEPTPDQVLRYGQTNPAGVILNRSALSEAVTSALVEYFLATGALDAEKLWNKLDKASTSERLAVLQAGSLALTTKVLRSKLRPGELTALLAEPGRAFSRPGYPPATSPAEILSVVEDTHLARASSSLDQVPWMRELYQSLPGLVASPAVLAAGASEYLWTEVSYLSASELEVFLSLAPEWHGTIPELLEMCRLH